MKKTAMETLVKHLNGEQVEGLDEIKADLEAELAKNKAKAEETKRQYAEMHDPIMETMRIANAPVTAQDIADATGFSRNKILYGFRNYWPNEIKVDRSGKVNTYTLAQ